MKENHSNKKKLLSDEELLKVSGGRGRNPHSGRPYLGGWLYEEGWYSDLFPCSCFFLSQR